MFVQNLNKITLSVITNPSIMKNIINFLFIFYNHVHFKKNLEYDVTRSKHPLNRNKELVLKDMNKVLFDISLGFRKLIPNNTLLIDDCT